jgi:hypothetical protein
MPPQPPRSPYYGQAGRVPTSDIRAVLRSDRDYKRKYTPAQQARMAVYNEALKYLDPTSRGQVMRQMAQEMPEVFRRYAGAPAPEPPTPGAAAGEYQAAILSPDRLAAAISGLAPKAGSRVGTRGGQYWLGDYLRTAKKAYGTGTERMSRAQRAYAEQRLGQLAEKAGQGGPGAGYVDLARALVDPVLHKAPTSGGLGTMRSVSTPGKPKRGASFAAGELT